MGLRPTSGRSLDADMLQQGHGARDFLPNLGPALRKFQTSWMEAILKSLMCAIAHVRY